MELTSALTTILAEPLTFDQDGRPRSAVRLGLDLAVSPSDIPAVRGEALRQIYAVLPDTDIAKFLVEKVRFFPFSPSSTKLSRKMLTRT
jgi:hypothetical protein